jgi:hypothetical protein
LKYFHILFHQHCKRIYSTEILFEDCCNIEFIRQNDQTNPLEEEEEISEISQVDEDDQYEEELAHKEAGSCEHTQEEDIQHHGQPAEEKGNNCCFIQKIQRPPPPLTEEEIDLLLNIYVTAPTHTDLQLSHSLGYECQTSSIYENVNLFLNDDSHVFDGTLQEVSEPIYDDFLPGDQLLDSVLFREKDMAAMFNDPEESLLFENALDCDLQKYDSEINSMPEIVTELPLLERSIVDVPRFCLTDDPPELSTEPKYDEYSDDYYIISVEQLVVYFSWRDDGIQTRLCHDFGDAIEDDLEGCLDILFENDPEHYKSEHRVVLDVLKPQDHIFFRDPFVDLLDSFNGGVCYVMDILSQESMKSLKIHDQQ